MKNTGIIILTIGLLFTLFTTFGLLLNERTVVQSKIETVQTKMHLHFWEPMLGAITIIVGGLLYKAGKKGEGRLA